MNADLDEAGGFPGAARRRAEAWPTGPRRARRPAREDHWRWRLRMAERIAARPRSGALRREGVYVFGSTKNATAGPGSDIDLIVHFRGGHEQRQGLERGWRAGACASPR